MPRYLVLAFSDLLALVSGLLSSIGAGLESDGATGDTGSILDPNG